MRTLSAILLCLAASSAPAHAGWRLFGGSKAAAKPTVKPQANPQTKPGAKLVAVVQPQSTPHDSMKDREHTAEIVQQLNDSMARLYKMKQGVHGWAAYRQAKTLFHDAMDLVEQSSLEAVNAASPDLAEQHKLRALAALRIAAHASDFRHSWLRTKPLLSGTQELRVEQMMKRLGIEDGKLQEAMEAAHETQQAQVQELALIRGAHSAPGVPMNQLSNAMNIHSGYRTPMQQSFAPAGPPPMK